MRLLSMSLENYRIKTRCKQKTKQDVVQIGMLILAQGQMLLLLWQDSNP